MTSRTASRLREREEVIHILDDDDDDPKIYIDGKVVETIDLSKSDDENANPRPSKKRRVTPERDNRNVTVLMERGNGGNLIGGGLVNRKGKSLGMIDLSQSNDENCTLPSPVNKGPQPQGPTTPAKNAPNLADKGKGKEVVPHTLGSGPSTSYGGNDIDATLARATSQLELMRKWVDEGIWNAIMDMAGSEEGE